MSESFAQTVEILKSAQQVVAFTGAGISAESGIPTFRDPDGLWEEFPPETFANWSGLLRTAFWKPSRLVEFLDAVFTPIADAEPNEAHRALAQLQDHVQTRIVTQNVDGLHRESGSRVVREIHGSFFRIITGRNQFLYDLTREQFRQITQRIQKIRKGPFKLIRLSRALAPILGLRGLRIKRPNLVLFGESLADPDWTLAMQDVEKCDVLIVVGTSGMVFPAAQIPYQAKHLGATVITIDPHEEVVGGIWLRGTAVEVLPLLIQSVLS